MEPIPVGRIITAIKDVLELIESRDPDKEVRELQEGYSLLQRCLKDIKALRPPFKDCDSFRIATP